MPATSTCPICGGALPNEELRFQQNIVFCDTGAVALWPTELTAAKALLRSPGGLETFQLAAAIGVTNRTARRIVARLARKLRDIGWDAPNIGCTGRDGALFVIRRKW